MKNLTRQLNAWVGDFGREYTDRNIFTVKELDRLYLKRYGISRTAMNKKFIGRLSKAVRILEVGSNAANQLICLQKIGFKDLYGIEPQDYALGFSRNATRNINIIKADGFDIPFKDNYFDIVFTSGVLIHISPKHIQKVMKEIYRCSCRYIWGFEYYSPRYTPVEYRGKKGLLWKANFSELYREFLPDLKLLKFSLYKYRENNNIDAMFLLKKNV